MSTRLFRSWIKNLGAKLLANGRRYSRQLRSSGADREEAMKMRPALELLEARLVPTGNTYTVTTNTEGAGILTGSAPNFSDTTVRGAIIAAEADGGGDTIIFASSLSGQTVTLTSTLPQITENLSIVGNGAAISGGGTSETITSASISGTTMTLNVSGTNTLTGGETVNIGGVIPSNALTGGVVKPTGQFTLLGATTSSFSYTVASGTEPTAPFTFSNPTAQAGNTIFNIASGVAANISSLTIEDGFALGNASGAQATGGGIYNAGMLTLSNSAISSNTAEVNWSYQTSIPKYGTAGGIYNTGTLVLANCTVSGNSATDKYGGIANLGVMTATGTTFSSNIGGSGASSTGGLAGAIYNSGTMTLNNSSVTANSASGSGGGIYSSGTLTLNDSNVSTNSGYKGGGIANAGVMTIADTNISQNVGTSFGGGICNNSGAFLTLSNSTVAGNTCVNFDGGGIQNGGNNGYQAFASLTMDDDTVVGNTVGTGSYGVGNGGAIQSQGGNLTLSNCTILGNSAYADGGAIEIEGDSAGGTEPNLTQMVNTIIAGNTAPTGPSLSENNNGGVTLNVTYCLFSDANGNGYSITNAVTTGDIFSANPGTVSTTLNGALTNSATTVAVTSAAALGTITNGSTILMVDGEDMLVTGVSVNTLTVTRGYDGTTAVAHNSGDSIFTANNGGPTMTLALGTGSSAIGKGGPITTVTSDGGSTIVVANGPAIGITSGAYLIQVGTEDMLVTGVSGNTLTVVRGYNGTTQTNEAGANVYLLTDQRGYTVNTTTPDIGAYQTTGTGPTPTPTISAIINPTSGPTSGGTSVTITGTNLANATAVYFGAVAGTIVSDTGTVIVAVTPGEPSTTNLTVDTTVTTVGWDTSAITQPNDQFTFIPTMPTVTSSTASLPANASTITINGTYFDTNTANDTVTFNDGAAGTVTSATTTSLTVTLPSSTDPTSAGSLTAVVTTDAVTSGSAVQVATVTPVVTVNAYSISLSSTTMTITGFGFDPTSPATNDIVSFSGGLGAVAGTVSSATATSLTVTISTLPTALGNLTAVVTTDSVTSGAAVQVATVALSVTASSTARTVYATTPLTISGFGFDTSAANDSVSFTSDGVVGTVTSATSTSLTIGFTTQPTALGALMAVVTTDGISSGSPVEVANVALTVTSTAANLAINATTIAIGGSGFDTTAAHDTVTFSDGALGTVTTATASSLTVTFTRNPTATGSLTASVTTDGFSNSNGTVQVATVVEYTAGDIVVLELANGAATTATTGTILELNPTTAGSAVLSTAINSTVTPSELKFMGEPISGTTATGNYLSDSSDGSQLVFDGYNSTGTTALDTLSPYSRGVGTINYGDLYSLAATYTGVSGDFARGATTVNDTSYYITDEKGLYTSGGSATITTALLSTKSFGGTVYASSGASASITTTPTYSSGTVSVSATNTFATGDVVTIAGITPSGYDGTFTLSSVTSSSFKYTVGSSLSSASLSSATAGAAVMTLSSPTATTFSGLPGIPADTTIQDFYLISSGNTPGVYDELYTLDQSSTTVKINKFSLVSGTWVSNGTYSSSTGEYAEDMAAAAKSGGGALLYITAGTTATSADANALYKLTDTAGYNSAITISTGFVSGNSLFAASGALSLRGVAFAPVQLAPTVMSASAALASNATTVTIAGTNFDPVALNNTVTFNDGAVGTVTSASASSLTVTFSTQPTAGGALTATVTTDEDSSGTAVEVATVPSPGPSLSSSTANLLSTATSMVISGSGFDTATLSMDVVSFNDGVTGTVSSATSTTLTVSLTGLSAVANLTALNANATIDGTSTGSAVEIATVVVLPTVTSSTTSLLANASTLTISGTNFSTTTTSDTVTFNDGAVGTVSAATATSITVTFSTKPTLVGSLTGVVMVSGVGSSGGAVQVATVLPVVTSSAANLAATASTLTIAGFGFDTTAANDTVTFNDSVTGTVSHASSTSLTVNITGIGGLTGGTSLTASATVDTNYSSGSAVQVASIAPVVTSSTAGLSTAATSLIINGVGFDTNTAHDNVSFDNGVTGSVTGASSTSLTVSLTGLSTVTVGTALHAGVTVDGTSSGSAVQVATVAALPTLTSSTAGLPVSSTSLIIAGSNFDTNTANDTVTFNDGVTGTVSSASSTSLTVNINGISSLTAGTSLTAAATVDGITSGSAVPVATLTPVVTSSAANLPNNSPTITINGYGFDTNTANDSVSFDNSVTGSVTAASATSLTVSVTGLTSVTSGSVALHAGVTVDGASSGSSIQVATVTAPSISPSSSSQTNTNPTVDINGSELAYYEAATSDSVVFTLGAQGTVTNGSNFGLVVTLSVEPTTVGALYATVTVPQLGVSAPTEVAFITAAPVVTSSTANLMSTASSLTINGVGFDAIKADDSVSFDDGVTGSVSSATSTSLTVSLTGLSSVANDTALHANVTVDGVSSGSVQVATVISLTPTTATLTDHGPDPSLSGASVSFTVSVSSVSPISGETVSIEDYTNGDSVVATPTLTTGTATFTISSLSVGSHALFAVYGGDGTNAASPPSSQVTQTVQSTFGVNNVSVTPDGVVLTFNDPIDANTTVLYSSPGISTAADVTVVNEGTSQVVRGSLVIDPTDPYVATFVQTSGLLAADTYQVTVTGGASGVEGLAPGGGADEVLTTTVSTVTVAAVSTPVLSVPSFARGPGQPVALTDSLGNDTGIPISINNATGVTEANFTLTYDPTLLTIAPSSGMGLDQVGALSLSSLATAAGINTINYSITTVDAHHDVLTVTLTSSGAGVGLTATSAQPLVTITASVPDTAPYLNKALLNLTNVDVNSASATGVSGVDENAYLGNVTGSGGISALDSSLADQVGAGAGTGFGAFKDLDPNIIGAVGDASVSALDASLIDQAGAGETVAQIPTVPNGFTLTTGGPDPYLYLSAVQGSAGQTVTETLYLDVTNPQGIQLSALDEAIGFDPSVLQISNVRSAAGLAGLGSYGIASTADNASGVLLVGQPFGGSGLPPVVPYGTDVAVLQFNVTLNANEAVGTETGLTLLQDGTVNGQTKYTAISDNAGALTWTPGMAPSNSGNAAVDGSVTVVPATIAAAPESVVSAPQPLDVIQPKVIEPVRRVTPVSSAPVSHPAVAASGTSVSLIVPLVNGEAVTPADTTVVGNGSGLFPSAVQPEASVVSSPVTVSITVAPEVVQAAGGAPSLTKAGDLGASLSLVAQGTNRMVAVAPPVTSSARTSTSVLDELYRQLGTLLSAPSVSGYNLGVTSDDTTEELANVWDLESLLEDVDS